MIKLFFTCLIACYAAVSFNAMAQDFEIQSYKNDGGNLIMTSQSFLTLWNSAEPVCVKSGSKIMGVNKAYKKAGLGYSDCSQSKAKKREHAAVGLNVHYIKLANLETPVIKKFIESVKRQTK